MLALALTATLALATPPEIGGKAFALRTPPEIGGKAFALATPPEIGGNALASLDCEELGAACGETGDSGVEEDTAVTSHAASCSTAPGAGWIGVALLPVLLLGRRVRRSG